jgi:hypothetical protein
MGIESEASSLDDGVCDFQLYNMPPGGLICNCFSTVVLSCICIS